MASFSSGSGAAQEAVLTERSELSEDVPNEDYSCDTREPVSAMEALAKFENQHSLKSSRGRADSTGPDSEKEFTDSGTKKGNLRELSCIQLQCNKSFETSNYTCSQNYNFNSIEKNVTRNKFRAEVQSYFPSNCT